MKTGVLAKSLLVNHKDNLSPDTILTQPELLVASVLLKSTKSDSARL